MRFIFIILPALFFGIVFSILHPVIGLIFFAGFVGLGFDVTEPRFERGESKYKK